MASRPDPNRLAREAVDAALEGDRRRLRRIAAEQAEAAREAAARLFPDRLT